MSRIFVSGYGVVSCLGLNAKENFDALCSQKTGIGLPNHLITNYKKMMVGEVHASNTELAKIAGISDINTSRTALLGLIAVQECIKNTGLQSISDLNIGLVNGTSVGGMDISEHAYANLLNGKKIDYKSSFSGHDCGHSTEFIAKKIELKGYQSTISTACSSSANTIMHAAKLIKSGHLDSAIAGGTDALSIFTLNGFNSLKILDENWCRPFDQNRQGLNLGEGAGFLFLESEAHLKARNGTALAELVGYGNANDAYHQTASSPEGKGAINAIKIAFEEAKMKPSQIGYVNAHGTGTNNNDNSESLALKATFGDKIPPYSSTKAYTGHTLGAAGGIEAVYSIFALQHQKLFPNLNLKQEMDLIDKPNKHLISAEVNAVLSNSFGFGGNCSSLIFSKV